MDESGRDGGSNSEPARTGAAAGAPGPQTPSVVPPPSLERRVTSLGAALRRARIDNAVRSEAVGDVRAGEIARLEILGEQLEPVLAQLPKDCDLFDVAISPGERPRLFVDQIGFVEMSRDRQNYRFLQDTRHGRIEICESENPEVLVEGITAYIAHRLIEREKALASDYASGAGASVAARAAARAPRSAKKNGFGRRALQAYLFLIEFLGAVLTFGLLGLLGWWLYRRLIGH